MRQGGTSKTPLLITFVSHGGFQNTAARLENYHANFIVIIVQASLARLTCTMMTITFGCQFQLDSPARLYRLYQTVQYSILCRTLARLACTITPTVLCNTVYYAVLLMMKDQIRSKHVQQTKYCGIKIDYKNCESRW